jgi:hypothetical protein
MLDVIETAVAFYARRNEKLHKWADCFPTYLFWNDTAAC